MDIAVLEIKLQKVIDYIDNLETNNLDQFKNINDEYLYSAHNLLQYIALRSLDIREVQSALVSYGISSLGTSAGYVRENISRSLALLQLIQGHTVKANLKSPSFGFAESDNLIKNRSMALFGAPQGKASTKIMVTMPEEASADIEIIAEFLTAGMDTARINLSHGDYHMWDSMTKNIVNTGQKSTFIPSVYMDLPGPKIRVDNIFKKHVDNNGYNTVEHISVKEEEYLELMKEPEFLNLKRYDKVNSKIITVLLPQIIDDIQIGHRVFFDDGSIEAKVISKSSFSAVLQIIKTIKKKLGSGKGINLPDTHLSLPSLTQNDLELLPYACKNADMIGYSFVRTREDVMLLYSKLSEMGDSKTGVIFKIETREAFENLPAILLEAMKRPRIGVMIARGDLAVEMGFERISEVKNQIMSICEAAHIPVIWATQVLENMAKKGLATRAEISDVILSGKAECVMLNKGPFMTDTIKTLKNILGRMDGHYSKNKNTLRALEVAKKSIEKMQFAL